MATPAAGLNRLRYSCVCPPVYPSAKNAVATTGPSHAAGGGPAVAGGSAVGARGGTTGGVGVDGARVGTAVAVGGGGAVPAGAVGAGDGVGVGGVPTTMATHTCGPNGRPRSSVICQN